MFTKKYPTFSRFLLAYFFILFFNPLFAQTPFLVKDISQIKSYGGADIFINKIGKTDNYACFFANDGFYGNELWITDGTSYGTKLLKDINPGNAGSGSEMINFCSVNGDLYFPIKLQENLKPELWKTNGTTEGTVLVSDGPFTQEPEEITALGNKILFKTWDWATLTYTLWVSDGTPTGTTQIKQFNSTYLHSFSFISYKDELLFAAGTIEKGVELWKTDGTTNGTVMVKDIYPDLLGSYPGNFTIYKNKVFFICNHPSYGNQIWMTDGTDNGTTLLKHLEINTNSVEPDNLMVINDSLYFVAFNEATERVLWNSDGSANNTLPVSNTFEDEQYGIYSIHNCDSFLIASVSKENSLELWRKNGTDGNYFKFKEFPVSEDGYAPFVEHFINAGKHSYFSIRTTSDPTGKLWITDGTNEGTKFLKDIEGPGSFQAINIIGFTNFANDLYFFNVSPQYGFPLWKSDGTTMGTTVIKDISNINYSNDFIANPGSNGDTLFFTGTEVPYKKTGLWRSQGTGKNTSLVSEIEGSVAYMKLFNGFIYLIIYHSPNEDELWKFNSNGTVKTKLAGGFKFINYDLFDCNGSLYFSAFTQSTGNELWVTDGTEQGTKMLMDIFPGPHGSNPESFYKSDTHLFFFAKNYLDGKDLWSIDLSNNIPSFMKSVIPGYSFNIPRILGIKNGEMYFCVIPDYNTLYTELWKSNGTTNGTYRIGTLPLIIDLTMQNASVLMNNHFYFSATNQNLGRELWRTDGTISGTTLVKDINPSPGGSGYPFGFFKLDNTILFYANTSQTGIEPWCSDGTANGTFILKDINIGTKNSSEFDKGSYYLFKGKAYFIALDSAKHYNIWATNGTKSGTSLVFNLNKSKGYFNPNKFYSADSTLFIAADSYFNQKGYGEELWSFRFCNDSIISLPATTDISFYHQTLNDTASCRCNILGELMDKVISNGVKPITGKINSKVWIQESAPTGYVNKVYEILPENKDSMATGTVTLYFTQEDFDAFNEINDNQLPENPFDSAGIRNLFVELRKGESKNGSGQPVSFRKQIETIHPGLDQIRWDSSLNRWEIEVAVTEGFGGFFVKADSCLLSESFTWRGSNSDDWDNENNWLEKAKPSMGANIIIPSYRRFYPLISQNIVVSKLQLEKGATLKINPGVVIDINEKICR